MNHLFLLARLRLLCLGLALFLLPSCYVTTQAWSQAKLLGRRQSIQEVLENPDTDSKTKSKLTLTSQVLDFAKSEGLIVGDSYTKYVHLDGPAVTYLVQAARPDEFKLKTWWFPVVGTVPYLGFFDIRDRDAYAGELVAEGFEVHRGAAAAFSSLGWFSDPVYSSMLSDDDIDLAHIYFHELTHKTAWIRGSVEFNENFAEFIGEAMTERFFTQLQRSEELKDWNVRRRDRERFKIWLKNLRDELERYFVDSKQENVQDLVPHKKAIIANHMAKKPSFERVDFVGTKEWNTPRILGASLYSAETSKFREAFECSKLSSLGDFAKLVKKSLEDADNSDEGLSHFCSHKT